MCVVACRIGGVCVCVCVCVVDSLRRQEEEDMDTGRPETQVILNIFPRDIFLSYFLYINLLYKFLNYIL